MQQSLKPEGMSEVAWIKMHQIAARLMMKYADKINAAQDKNEQKGA